MHDAHPEETNLGYSFDWDPGDLANNIPLEKDFFTRTLEGIIDRHIPRGDGECLEVGCYPGRFLTLFGDRGYTLSGIDFAKNLAQVPAWLQSRGYAVGRFDQADFMTHDFGRRFDVVYSLGFIEHLTNWPDAIARHAALVKPGGSLMIGAPNFSGLLQRVLHRYLDLWSYERHYTPSMSAEAWGRILARLGFEVLYQGTPYPFMFEIAPDYANTHPAKKAFLQAVTSVAKAMRDTPRLDSVHASYYHMAIARAPRDIDVAAVMREPSFASFLAEVTEEALTFDRRVDATADAIIAALDACAANLARDRSGQSIGAGMTLGDALMILCHPFLAAKKPGNGEMELLASLAATAWNLSFLESTAAESVLSQVAASLTGDDAPGKTRHIVETVHTMIGLKKRYFPKVNTVIRSHHVRFDPEGNCAIEVAV